jgi:hypothetical protein
VGHGYGISEGKEESMCLSCGCGEPDADHGDSRHITMAVLRQAAEAAEITPQEAADNIKATLAKA